MISSVTTALAPRGFAGEKVAAPTTNSWAASRAVVDTATAAATTVGLMIYEELHPPGFQLFEESSGYWKVIQYPESIYACNTENMKKVSFRGDFWIAAQVSLARCFDLVRDTPFRAPLPPVGTPERRYVAALFADWYVTVMTWVSMAAYSTNIQPAFLCPDAALPITDAAGQSTYAPLLLPTRTVGDGLPSALATLRNEIKGLTSTGKPGEEFADKWLDKGVWGPMWMGFYDRGEATGWLKREFAPHEDPIANALKAGNGGVDYVYPNRANRPLPPDSASWSVVRSRIDNPWYQVYYSLLWFDFSELIVDWRQHDTTGLNETFTRWMLGPGALLQIGKAWARWVCEQKIMDVIVTSASWYSTAYFSYWNSKGLLSFSPSQSRDAQIAIAKQKQALKQQTAMSAVNTVTNVGVQLTVALAPVPWAGAVAAGCALLISGIGALICRRRRKKKVSVPLMQPLMLRSLSNPECNYFAPSDTLEGSLVKLLDEVKRNTASLTASPAGIVPPTRPDDPLAAEAPVSAGTTADSVLPTARPSTTSGSAQSGAPVATSTSGLIPAAPAIPPVQQIEAQAVQALQTSPTSTQPPAPQQQVNWALIGLGATAAVATIAALRRR